MKTTIEKEIRIIANLINSKGRDLLIPPPTHMDFLGDNSVEVDKLQIKSAKKLIKLVGFETAKKFLNKMP